jgi:disulfide bond formation protein DsbB
MGWKMKGIKPVSISKNAFRFCKFGVMIIVIIGLVLRNKWFIVLSFLILFFSAILKIRKAPMISFYSFLEKIFDKHPKTVILDENAMRFAHTLGSIVSGIAVVLLFRFETLGWIFVIFFAILKIISAFGLCPGEKLYKCMNSGTCCTFLKPEHSKIKFKKSKLKKSKK